MEAGYVAQLRELEGELAKYKELIKYVETRYSCMLREEEEERDEEVQTLLKEN